MPRLLIQHGGENSRVFELLGERPISIGRAKSSTIVLDDTSVSRLHAIVSPNLDGQWQIVDRESSNGLKVNGVKVKEATLRADDEIMVGEFHLDSKIPSRGNWSATEPRSFRPRLSKC